MSTNPEGSVCGITERVELETGATDYWRCGKDAPEHALTLNRKRPDGSVDVDRKPICDEHFEALKITMDPQ